VHDAGEDGMKNRCAYKALDNECPIYYPINDSCDGIVDCRYKFKLSDMKCKDHRWKDELDRKRKKAQSYLDEVLGIWY